MINSAGISNGLLTCYNYLPDLLYCRILPIMVQNVVIYLVEQ